MEKNIKYAHKSKMKIFAFIQLGIFFISFGVYLFTKNPIIRFYTFLVLSTVGSLIVFQILLLFIYLFYKSKSFKNRIASAINVLLFMGAIILFTNNTIKYYKDIPYVINGEYSVIVGECTYCYAYRGRDSRLDMTIGDVKFKVALGYNTFVKKGRIYKVEYLPNTKEVLHIYMVN